MSGSGNGSNSSNVNTGTSTGAVSRSKNAPGNRTDIGWKHGTNCLSFIYNFLNSCLLNDIWYLSPNVLQQIVM